MQGKRRCCGGGCAGIGVGGFLLWRRILVICHSVSTIPAMEMQDVCMGKIEVEARTYGELEIIRNGLVSLKACAQASIVAAAAKVERRIVTVS